MTDHWVIYPDTKRHQERPSEMSRQWPPYEAQLCQAIKTRAAGQV